MSQIIEFVGVPGSGKTTLVSMLAEELEPAGGNGHARTSFIRRGWLKMLAFACHWRVLVVAVRAMRSDGRSLARRVRALRWVLSTLEQYRTTGDTVVLIPEGSLQRALLLFFTPGEEVDRHLLQRYLRVAPLADVVVRLVVSPGEAARRNQTRKTDPRDGRANRRFFESDQPVEKALKEADSFIQSLLAEASRRPGVDVVTIESHSKLDLSEAVQDILQHTQRA